MNAFLLLAGFALMCVLPLLPGLLEVLRPRDRYPLPVDLEYAKDPRYLGNSLRGLLARALAAADQAPPKGQPTPARPPAAAAEAGAFATGTYELALSRQETVRVTGDHAVGAGEVCRDVLFVQGDLHVAEGAVCERELHVRGVARLDDRARVRALAGDRDVTLGDGVAVLRWLDADGDLRAAPACRLGQHCAAGGALALADGCRFARLFSPAITTPGAVSRPVPPARGPRLDAPRAAAGDRPRNIDDVLRYERGDLTLAAGRTIDRDLLVHGDLTVERGATLAGCLRVRGAVRLGEGVTVLGSVFADGPIQLGAGATVAGNVFGQDTVLVEPGVQVGRRGAIKSLIGNRGVTLRQNVIVHGYVLTEGEGVVRCTAD